MKPALVIIDTISKTFGAGKENTDDMASYVANCGRVSAEFNCCIVAVHHRPKDTESEEPRGHGSLKGGVDTVILVEAGRIKRARLTKQKDGEIGAPIFFKLLSVALGFDDDGQTVTSCVVEQVESGENPAGSKTPFSPEQRLSDGSRLALAHLDQAVSAEGVCPPDHIPSGELDRAVVTRVVAIDVWRQKVIMAAGTEAGHQRDSGKTAFNRAKTKLQALQIIKVYGDFVWREVMAGTSAGRPVPMSRDNGTYGTQPLRVVPMSHSHSAAHALGEKET